MARLTSMNAAPPTLVAINRVALRRIRMRSGMSQVSLAAKALISQGYLSQLENGIRRYVGPEAYSRLVAALKVDYDDLLLTDEAEDEDGDDVDDAADAA